MVHCIARDGRRKGRETPSALDVNIFVSPASTTSTFPHQIVNETGNQIKVSIVLRPIKTNRVMSTRCRDFRVDKGFVCQRNVAVCGKDVSRFVWFTTSVPCALHA